MKRFFEGKVEKIKLIAGHAIMLSHLPNKASMEAFHNKLLSEPLQDMGSFGLFDSSSPNYTTYYPEVTEEDLKPKDNEFIEPVFRMLSNTVVQHRYNPIEFPAEVLKKSMGKLVGQTINADHETALGNGLGVIKSVEWQEPYTLNGLKVPAGINAVLKIDGKSNPRIARGIMMEPPSIHSNSVTVGFTWAPSHPNLTEEQFYNKLGSFDEKGKLIRKVATEIMFYAETSLVGMGADPFAQMVKDGKIVNPVLAKSRRPIDEKQLGADSDGLNDVITYDWKNFTEKGFSICSNSLTEEDIQFNNKNKKEMNELLRFLETLFGLAENSLAEDNYEVALNAIGVQLTNLNQQVVDLKNQPPTIEGLVGTEAIANAIKELTTLKSQLPADVPVSTLTAMYAVGTKAVTDLKADTVKLYKLSLKGKAEDAAIIKLIEDAEGESLKALNTQYENLSESVIELTCAGCGSHDITRASANPEQELPEKGKFKSVAETVKGATGLTAERINMYGAVRK